MDGSVSRMPGGFTWIYDPYIFQFDDQLIKVQSGTVDYFTNKIRFQAAVANFTTLTSGGDHDFKFTIPTAPTGGDSRIWGMYSLARGNVNAAYFFISGTSFFCRTYDKEGTVQSTTVTWNSDWTNTAVNWIIRLERDQVSFWAGDQLLATHGTSVPDMVMLPPYVANTNGDEMLLTTYEVKNAQRILFSEPYSTDVAPTSTTSTSTTSSTTTTTTTTTTSSSTTSSTSSTTSTSSSTTTTSSSTTTTTTSSSTSSTTSTSSSTTTTSSSTTTTSSSTTTTTTSSSTTSTTSTSSSSSTTTTSSSTSTSSTTTVTLL